MNVNHVPSDSLRPVWQLQEVPGQQLVVQKPRDHVKTPTRCIWQGVALTDVNLMLYRLAGALLAGCPTKLVRVSYSRNFACDFVMNGVGWCE